MENDLKSKMRRVSAEEKRILLMKRKMKYWTVGLVLLTLAAIGLFSMVYFPDTIQKALNMEITIGKTNSAIESQNAYIGIEIRDLPKGSSSTLNLGSIGGVVISRVAPSSPAAQGGLKAGDIILRYNRTLVTDTAQFQKLVVDSDPGDRVKIVVDRNGNTRYFYVLLSSRPSSIQLTAGPPFNDDDAASTLQWGCTLSPLTTLLVQKLSIPSDMTGVVVVSVSNTGLAKTAGLLPGDLIISVNRESVKNMADFYDAIKDQENLALEIYRNGSVLIIQVEQKAALPPLVTIAGSVATAGSVAAGTTTAGTTTVTLPQRVAIAAAGNDLNAQLALRFGTAPYFIIIDTKTGQYVVVPNNLSTDSRGYGIAAAQLVASKGAGAAVAAAFGPQAYDALLALNVKPFIANSGKVIDVFNQYKQFSLTQITDPTLPGYAYARSIVTTGGPPTDDEEDDEDEEQSGYKGVPYTIPPQGKYDPALDPNNTATATQTAGSVTYPAATTDQTLLNLNLNQQSVTCLCPVCKATYDHPPGVPCSSLICPKDGSRLISLNSGSAVTSQAGSAVTSQATTVVTNTQLPQRVAIASTGNTLNSLVSTPFGLARYFIIVDLKTNQITAIANTGLLNTGSYAIAAAQLVAKQGVDATIAVSYGLPAYYSLRALNISTYTANPGTVATVMNQYRTYSLTLANTGSIPYSQNFVAIGGPPTDDEDDEEEVQSGYKGMPYTIPPQGQYDPALDPANALQTTAGTTTGTTQRAEYCLCPICNILVPHAPGISCSDMACPQCGNRLMNADPGVTATTTPTTTQTNVNQLPSQTLTRTGTVVVAGQPTAGTSTLSTGLLQGTIDGSCLCPKCGTTVPHVKGTACSTLACPSCGTPMIGYNTSTQVAPATTIAGMPTAGMPTAGTTTSGMPDSIPPADMGMSTAGALVAGIPNISTQIAGTITVAGMPTAGMPTAGMPTAGTTTSGLPDDIPPDVGTEVGQGVAGVTVAGIPNISTQIAGTVIAGMPTAGMPTAGMPTAGMPTAGTVIAGMPTAGVATAAITVAGSNSSKVCIASTGTTLESKVADLFDKAPYFLIVGLGKTEVITNPNVNDLTGSGVQSAQLVVHEGADVVITNDIGIKAIETLQKLQVKVYTGVTGTVKDALTWYQNNRLTQTKLNSSTDQTATDDDDEEEDIISVGAFILIRAKFKFSSFAIS